MNARVIPLTATHVEPLATMLAHTFDDDAAYRYLFPNASTRARGLRDFFAGNLKLHLSHRCTFVAESSGGEPLATVTLRPPAGFHISWWTMLQSGLLGFVIKHGRTTVQRMLWLKETYGQLEQNAAKHAPHGFVHMMAVSPAQQGRGLGSWLLAEVMGKHARSQVVLTTHLTRNLTFYRRHGFEVVEERTLTPPSSTPYPVWSMIKRA